MKANDSLRKDKGKNGKNGGKEPKGRGKGRRKGLNDLSEGETE